jgi:hypothetical protein
LGNLTGLIEQIKPVVAKGKDLDTTAKPRELPKETQKQEEKKKKDFWD